MTALVPLADADHRCGGKAAALGAMIRDGVAVPPGLVVTDPIGTAWREELPLALGALGPGPYAVRSSALMEDGLHASFAGQLHTSLDVHPAAVAEAVVRTSQWAYRGPVEAYAARLGRRAGGPVPVLVQQMVAPVVAGVAFSRHPVTGEPQCVVEAARGLGAGVVGGAITPERWTVTDGTPEARPERYDRVLTPEQVLSLADLAGRAEALFGRPQDIEWAFDADQLWLLQARPITTIPRPSARPAGAAGSPLLTGTPTSPGEAVGAATVVRDLDAFPQLRAGDVLVCRATSPAWTPLLARAAAVVTETGGILSHAAIVAREFGIPAVTAAEGAMARLAAAGTIVVDGDRGTVRTLASTEARR